jgi:hypothetical protein
MTTTTPQFTSLREKIAFETAQRKARYAAFAADWSAAEEAGRKAACDANPTPMVIEGRNADGVHTRYVVGEGPCGYAYVTIHPATSSFARWIVKEGIGRKAYRGGVEVSVFDYNQSMTRKAAHAKAVAEYLTAKGYAGIDWFDRID